MMIRFIEADAKLRFSVRFRLYSNEKSDQVEVT